MQHLSLMEKIGKMKREGLLDDANYARYKQRADDILDRAKPPAPSSALAPPHPPAGTCASVAFSLTAATAGEEEGKDDGDDDVAGVGGTAGGRDGRHAGLAHGPAPAPRAGDDLIVSLEAQGCVRACECVHVKESAWPYLRTHRRRGRSG